MEPLEQLAKVSQGLTDLHANFVGQIKLVQDEGTRQYMTSLAAKLQTLHGEAMRSFPKAFAAIQSQVAKTQQQNAQILQQVASLKAKQAEAQASAATASKARAEATAKVDAEFKTQAVAADIKAKEPTLPPMSAQLSDTLRDELLQKFGLKEAPRRKPAEFQEAPEEWQRARPMPPSIVMPG
jgi:chromosome segregation ATPase